MEAFQDTRDPVAIRIAGLEFLPATKSRLRARGIENLSQLASYLLRELDLDFGFQRFEIKLARKELRLRGADFAIRLASGKQQKTPVPSTVPTRVHRLLARDLLATCLEEVAQYSITDLRKKGGFGDVTIALLTEILKEHGLEFRREE